MMGGMAAWLYPLHADPENQPEPLTLLGYLTRWQWDWWAGPALLLGLALYLWGVRRLAKRGDSWPVGRTIAWVAGMATLTYAMLGALGVYDTVLFSVHMIQHMLLNMVAPVFLAQGAPITLALRVLSGRARHVLLAVIHSWPVKAILFPGHTVLAMISLPFVLYPTGLYEFTLRNNLAHDLLHLWMVVIGCAFFFVLLGVDPTPWRMPYPLRILLFFLTMPFHAFVGTMIMGSKSLVAEAWYLSFDRTWGPSPLADQYVAGAILWATGDLTMVSTMSALFVGWWRESQREAKREDRRLDREEQLRALSGDVPGDARARPSRFATMHASPRDEDDTR